MIGCFVNKILAFIENRNDAAFRQLIVNSTYNLKAQKNGNDWDLKEQGQQKIEYVLYR